MRGRIACLDVIMDIIVIFWKSTNWTLREIALSITGRTNILIATVSTFRLIAMLFNDPSYRFPERPFSESSLWTLHSSLHGPFGKSHMVCIGTGIQFAYSQYPCLPIFYWYDLLVRLCCVGGDWVSISFDERNTVYAKSLTKWANSMEYACTDRPYNKNLPQRQTRQKPKPIVGRDSWSNRVLRHRCSNS